ncbi:hypothetical protein FKM82_026300 [Ascaphus truei]
MDLTILGHHTVIIFCVHNLVSILRIYFNCLHHTDYFFHTNNKIFTLYFQDVVKSVQMMNQNDTFNLGVIEELNARILQLPYGEGDLSMFILLTDEMTGLEKVFYYLLYSLKYYMFFQAG